MAADKDGFYWWEGQDPLAPRWICPGCNAVLKVTTERSPDAIVKWLAENSHGGTS